MKNISLIKAKKIKEKFKEIWITVSVIDIQILFYLLEIYALGLNWELEWVEKINNDYIYIYSTFKLISKHYPEIKKLKSNNYFSIKRYYDLGLLNRVMSDDKRNSYIKPTELLFEYIK